jgi:hypothetical protein
MTLASKKGAVVGPLLDLPCIGLVFHLVASFEALYPSPSINQPALAGEEGMALAAQLYFEQLLGGAGGKGITASANYLSIVVVLGVDFVFHYSAIFFPGRVGVLR